MTKEYGQMIHDHTPSSFYKIRFPEPTIKADSMKDHSFDRRDFLKALLATACIPAFATERHSGPSTDRKTGPAATSADCSINPSAWKGFNLLNKFNPDTQTPFNEKDFEIMAEWGFNFVRLPMSYWCWSAENDWFRVDEKILSEIDHAVEFGRQYGIHVNINFHRVPGYCINPPRPAHDLFNDEEALLACEHHWRTFAERYAGYSSQQLSFNLINEAPSIADEKYEHVVRRLIKTIRDVSPSRTIIVDGLDVGGRPLMSLTDIKDNIVQSGRGYQPMLISHYAAEWVYGKGPMHFPKENLSWPLEENGKTYNRNTLAEILGNAWHPWTNAGGQVHIGEFGCHNRTPHHVAMAWLSDLLSVFTEYGWGWALWDFTGSFGVLDSGRSDVKYEQFKGHKLDRRMLELLQSHLG